MAFLCKLFGHRLPFAGWWGDGLYGEVSGGYTDGIGRTHFQATQVCSRCGQRWTVARFHGHQVRKDPA